MPSKEQIHVEKVNEVYNRIICDRGTLAELSEYFTFFVPGYQFMPSYRNKMWDGKIRLLNTSTHQLYGGLENYLESFAREREYEIVYDYDRSAKNFSLVEADQFIAQQDFSIAPRDYQTKALVDAVRYSRQLFLSPTASGKSFIMYMIMRYYLTQTLIIVPTTTLVHQLASDFKSYGFNSDKYIHKIHSGEAKDTSKPIVITTWQSVYRLPKEWFDRFNLVLGDEAHNFKAKSLASIMEKLTDCKYRFGFTGTLDGTATHRLVLEGLFGPVNKVITTKELMDQSHLSDLTIKVIVLKYADDVKKYVSGLKYQDEMNYLVTDVKRNAFIKNLALSLKGNTLLLFQYVDNHGKILYDLIRQGDETRPVYFIHGGVEGQERDEIRSIVESQDNAIIVASYGTFSTGINIRNLHSLIFASPSKSKIRNLQSIGRTLRKSDTKDSATLYDIADDFSWKKKRNYTLNHLVERMKVYDAEGFKVKTYTVGI